MPICTESMPGVKSILICVPAIGDCGTLGAMSITIRWPSVLTVIAMVISLPITATAGDEAGSCVVIWKVTDPVATPCAATGGTIASTATGSKRKIVRTETSRVGVPVKDKGHR